MLEVSENIEVQKRYYSALFRLNGLDAEFKDILAVFAHTMGVLHKANTTERNPIDINQRQGALQLIETFFRHIEKSRERLEKLERKI